MFFFARSMATQWAKDFLDGRLTPGYKITRVYPYYGKEPDGTRQVTVWVMDEFSKNKLFISLYFNDKGVCVRKEFCTGDKSFIRKEKIDLLLEYLKLEIVYEPGKIYISKRSVR